MADKDTNVPNKNDFISREAAVSQIFDGVWTKTDADGYVWVLRRDVIHTIDEIPAADVVARDCYDRILAENDTMRNQLAEVGKKVGDTMDDVRPVVHGEWIDYNPEDPHDPRMKCSKCGIVAAPLADDVFCPRCGADMHPVNTRQIGEKDSG